MHAQLASPSLAMGVTTQAHTHTHTHTHTHFVFMECPKHTATSVLSLKNTSSVATVSKALYG